MTLRLGDDAPNFQADTTEGPIDFYDWKGDSWAVLFSHPKDFTPVCTTELGYTAKLGDEFAKRNVKVLAVSVDSVEEHKKWASDIKETQGHALNFPLVADSRVSVSFGPSATTSKLRSRNRCCSGTTVIPAFASRADPRNTGAPSSPRTVTALVNAPVRSYSDSGRNPLR